MKTTIEYKVLFYDGNKGELKAKYECPDFEDIEIEPLILNGKQVSEGHTNTISMQIDEWVGEFDKSEWMRSNEVMMIFDWEVISAKSKSLPNTNLVIKEKKLSQSEMVGLFVQASPMSDELKTEFIAVYSEMKPSIKNLHFSKQIDITFNSLTVGLKAAIEAYKYLTRYQKTLNEVDSKSWITHNNGRTTYDRDKLNQIVKSNMDGDS